MAEPDSGKTPDPVPETKPYLGGVFNIGKVLHDVTLSETHFSWTKRGDTTAKKVCAPIEEILSVNKITGRAAGESVVVVGFSVVYIKHKKNYVMKPETVQFLGSSEEGEEWSRKIEEALEKVKQRPRKLLVLINPISGNSNGKKIYSKQVAGLFRTAHVETDVIVTQKAHHTEEILAEYDLTSIDGIVLVGGDGLYHEATNGLQHRMIKEARIDENDSSIDLQAIPIPMGIIPAGTGNGIAANCYGNYDVTTAALCIIRGKKRWNSLVSVHCRGELVTYSSLLVGMGLWSDMIYSAEKRRYLGKLRYPVCIIEVFVKAFRRMDLTFEYLPPRPLLDAQQGKDTITRSSSKEDKDNGPVTTLVSEQPKENQRVTSVEPAKESTIESKEFTDTTAGAELKTDEIQIVEAKGNQDLKESKGDNSLDAVTEWKTKQGVYIGSFVMVEDCLPPMGQPPTESCITELLTKPCSKLDFARFTKQMIKFDTAMFENEDLECLSVKDFKVTVNKVSDPETELGKLQRAVNIDGEFYRLKHPEIHCRLHPKTVHLYCQEEKINIFAR